MMNTAPISTPRFRTDLVAQPIDTEGQRFVDVTDPDSGRTFRFYEVEYSIACAMNGQRNLGGLANWALEELGLETTPDELETVITTLAELGYLDHAAAAGDLGVELGRAGGTAPRAVAAAPPVGDLELGAPGKSPIARERPAPPAVEAIELGTPGAIAAGMASRQAASPVSEPGSADDMSFEGLLDATGVGPAPEGLSRDDAPTAVRPSPSRPQLQADESDFGLEGLTPPPAEVPSASLRPSTEPASDDDGPTNLPPPAPGLEEEEVSVDLSEHLSIGADDLKEAVRQSQVMSAVTVPPELLAELEGEMPPDEVPVSEQAARQAPAPIEVEDRSSEPIELPATRATVSKPEPKPPVEPPPQREEPKSSAGILLLLLVFVLVGAGAAYYFLVYKKQQNEQAGRAPVTKPQTTGQPPVAPPQPPALPSAILAEAPGTSATIAMPEPSGAVEWLADDGAEVEAGDELVRLKGYARLEKKARDLDVRGLQYQDKLDRANAALEKAADDQKARHASNVKTFEAKVAEKMNAAKAIRDDELSKLAITAPAAGTVKVLGKVGAWIKAGDPLLEVSTTPVLTATFTLPSPSPAAAGDLVEVTVKGAAADAAPAECEVTIVEGTKLTVRCPSSELAAGAEIVLK